MAITREDVLHVARLARLEIPEGEVDRVRDEADQVVVRAVVSPDLL